jgi:hypothetical protein
VQPTSRTTSTPASRRIDRWFMGPRVGQPTSSPAKADNPASRQDIGRAPSAPPSLANSGRRLADMGGFRHDCRDLVDSEEIRVTPQMALTLY